MNSRRPLLALARGLARAEDACSSAFAASHAVFLHGGWRCGSTYIWNRFREAPGTHCFYEPFHEGLSRITRRRIERQTTGAWNSRHPKLERPYWEEYLPLLRPAFLRGVRRYRPGFAVAEYFPTERGIQRQLDYVRLLVEHAQGSGKVPVLGFSRSLARAPAIKQALGGLNVVLRRNPRQQWLSCRSYRVAGGTVYFELCQFLILALAPSQSLAGRYACCLGLPLLPPGSFRNQFRFMYKALWPWTDDLSYRAFLGVHQLSHDAASGAADLTIDVDRLSRETHYRREVRAAILEGSGLAIHFDDCRIGAHDTAGVRVDFAAVERDVFRLLRAFGAKVPAEYELSLVWNRQSSVRSR